VHPYPLPTGSFGFAGHDLEADGEVVFDDLAGNGADDGGPVPGKRKKRYI
jgi:hypothetical protein